MLDLNFVRDNLPRVEEMLRQRGADPAAVLKDFSDVDTQRRQAITETEMLKARRNTLIEDFQRLMSKQKQVNQKGGDTAANDQARSGNLAEQAELKKKIQTADKLAEELNAKLKETLNGIPNMPHPSVPVGHSAEENVEVRRWGTPPQFDFTPKPHWDLGAELGVLDLERAVKLTGARFAVYWDLGAKLERALANFMLDLHTREHGYIEVLPPYLVNSESMYGTGQLPKFAADSFRVSHGEKDFCRSRISIVMKFSMRHDYRSHSPLTLRAFAARRDHMAKTCAALSGSISFRKWSWLSSPGPRIRTKSTRS